MYTNSFFLLNNKFFPPFSLEKVVLPFYYIVVSEKNSGENSDELQVEKNKSANGPGTMGIPMGHIFVLLYDIG